MELVRVREDQNAARNDAERNCGFASVSANRLAIDTYTSQTTAIKVVGVGGAGNAVVELMVAGAKLGIELIALDTDAQALLNVNGPERWLLGVSTVKGMGYGGDPEKGRLVATGDRPRIQRALRGASLVVIVAGMGGGTGTGASPVVAQVASELDTPAVCVVTRPMSFEYRGRAAEDGIAELVSHADRVLVNHGQDVLDRADDDISLDTLLDAVRDVQLATVRHIVRPASTTAAPTCVTYTPSTYDAEVERLIAFQEALDLRECDHLDIPRAHRRQVGAEKGSDHG